jgi:hypothetical protein
MKITLYDRRLFRVEWNESYGHKKHSEVVRGRRRARKLLWQVMYEGHGIKVQLYEVYKAPVAYREISRGTTDNTLPTPRWSEDRATKNVSA